MRKHETTFSEVVQMRAIENGMNLKNLEKKTGIPHSTFSRRMKYSDWRRQEMQLLNRFIHFKENDLLIFLEGK